MRYSELLSSAPTTEMTVFGGTYADEDCVGTICIVTRDHINAATTTALLHTDFSWVPRGKYVERNIIQGNLLTLQRNEALQRMKGDWLLFIDDDMVWRSDAVGRLVASVEEFEADMMGALCFRRSAPYHPTLYMREQPDAGMYNFLEKWDTDIIEVDATGMAFCLIHKRALEKMTDAPVPPLEVRLQLNPPDFFRWEGALGEDLRFCQDAKRAGVRILVDTRIEIGHISEVEIGHRNFLLEALARDPELLAARRIANDAMGLPTLEPEEASRLLGGTR